MEFSALALAGLLMTAPSITGDADGPNCDDDDDSTPCCPLEERHNFGAVDAWLDCIGWLLELPRETQFE